MTVHSKLRSSNICVFFLVFFHFTLPKALAPPYVTHIVDAETTENRNADDVVRAARIQIQNIFPHVKRGERITWHKIWSFFFFVDAFYLVLLRLSAPTSP